MAHSSKSIFTGLVVIVNPPERVASALGHTKQVGILCEQTGIPEPDLITRMNEKVDFAGEILETTYTAFDKDITLPQPFYYETRMILACDVSPIPGAYAPFWYHPDHLGSSSYITNLAGEITQHMEYLPFGELLVEEHLNSYNSPFKFNAKEFDAETGNYYYGARYYDPKWSLWISVDPLAEEFPHQSPYVFSNNNPINFIDPDGRAAFRVNGDPPYKIKNGVLSGPKVVNDITSKTHRPKMSGGVTAIVLHRTVSSNASSAINTSKNNKGATGFHIVVDKDGSITQLNNFENRANHVGKPTGDVNNYNSIGIEVVGMSVDKDGNPTTDWRKTTGWEALTDDQIESTAQSVNAIMTEYDLGIDDIFPHEDVSRKVDGEGGVVLDAIRTRVEELNAPPPEAPPVDSSLQGRPFKD